MMRRLFVCLISLFFVTVITSQECSPCNCFWSWKNVLIADCTPEYTMNRYTEIPDTVNRSANELHFDGQSFTILKNNTFTTFHNLTFINFKENNIQIIEREAFQNLTVLSTLWLHGNNIKSLPDGIFHDLRQIKRLFLGQNRITELPKNIFANLTTLSWLWLYDNKIKDLPDGIFHDLRQIEVITLSRNNITKLRKNVFSNLPHLFQVDISYNQINTIEAESFSKLPNIKTVIDLHKNELQKLQINIIDNVQQLKHFALSDNSWHCDEDLCAVMDSIPNYSLYMPTCRTPAEIEGKRWSQLLDAFSPNISKNSQNAEAGETVYLECKYCFVSKIIWRFNSTRISRHHIVAISKISLTSTLTLNNVTQDDTGYYSCQIQSCATCAVASIYLKVNDRTLDDDKYTVTDLVPTSLVTQATATKIPGDKKTNSPFSLCLIVAVTVLTMLLAVAISIFYRQKSKHNKIQKEQGTEFKYSHRRGSDPVLSPPPELGWGFTPRISRMADNSNKTNNEEMTNKHESSKSTAHKQTSTNRRNEQTSRDHIIDETNNGSTNEQLTSDNGRTDDTACLLPMESIE